MSQLSKPTNLKELRQKLRFIRQSLSNKEREQKSLLIFQNLSRYLPFHQAKNLAAYWSTSEEVATYKTIRYATNKGKTVYLPTVNSTRCNSEPMTFERYIPGKTAMKANKFGIQEPERQLGNPNNSKNLDLILVPLLGFNQNCDRIGMGGGYYDRVLSSLDNRNTKFIGLAFTCQKAEFDPMSHDIRLHAIITEEGVLSY